ncbi:MAG: L-2-amino-thiazoline-4-carboxylic acid hydrolase [Bacilli bacterium]
MDYKKTNINFLHEDLIKEHGKELGNKFYAAACKKYTSLCENESKSENVVMNDHIFNRFLPAVSLYFSLIENNFSKEEALEFTLKETQRNAQYLAKKNEGLTKMPFSYGMFKMFSKSHMKKNYPIEGFTVEWKQLDKKEVHFDITRCIYKDMCEKYGCPQLSCI